MKGNIKPDIHKNILNFWIRVKQMITNKEWLNLLKYCTIKGIHNNTSSPVFNIYAFLALLKTKNKPLLKKCLSKLLELELKSPKDVFLKFNIVNFYI